MSYCFCKSSSPPSVSSSHNAFQSISASTFFSSFLLHIFLGCKFVMLFLYFFLSFLPPSPSLSVLQSHHEFIYFLIYNLVLSLLLVAKLSCCLSTSPSNPCLPPSLSFPGVLRGHHAFIYFLTQSRFGHVCLFSRLQIYSLVSLLLSLPSRCAAEPSRVHHGSASASQLNPNLYASE